MEKHETPFMAATDLRPGQPSSAAADNLPHRHIRPTRHYRECTGTNTEDRSHCSRCVTTRVRFSVIRYNNSVSGITREKGVP